jgi:CubicO group peptidase (beta-lactamase class C family)
MLRRLIAAVVLFTPAVAAAQVAVPIAQVDRVFARWNTSTPGCAVGVSVAGKPVLTRAYGIADLEHGVPNTAETIFEGGSIAKQFTAAAVLLLARDGKLSLDDEVRKYIPELPDYGTPLTIRHMLTHTSGLRDWGSVAGIGGWPRGQRAHTQAHVLDIVSRQRALNFTPGTRYSYTNTGYNLAAIIVSRVSGMPFAEFTKRRIFEPLGMTRSSWRDDFARIVKGRAIAYSPQGDGYRQEMPFENAHGNGGVLTTVGDLLKWTANFATPKVGDEAFVSQQIEPGRFTDGRAHGYAMGLQVGSFRGVREISHGGATAGYRTQLSLYPDQGVTVAVLCNVANANPGAAANAVAELYLAGRLTPSAPPQQTQAPKLPPAQPTRAQLEELAGTYVSDEAEASMIAAVEDGVLVLKRRPATTIRLTPASSVDAFDAPGLGAVTFRRDATGRSTEFSVTQERVWDLRFAREESPASTARN